MIETERLILRAWRPEDREPYAAMCASPAVMRHLGGPHDGDAIDAAIARNQRCQDERGYCFWAVERRDEGDFVGFCGLRIVDDPTRPVHGEIEIGWRLREDQWGRGIAREAAAASLSWGWAMLDVARTVSFTIPANRPSWRLMERLGMARRPDLDFDHPAFPPGHPLCRHVTYEARCP